MVCDISSNNLNNIRGGVMDGKLDGFIFYGLCLICVAYFWLAKDLADDLSEVSIQVKEFKQCMQYNFEEQCMHILEEKE